MLSKKITVLCLISAILCGGAWYLNVNNGIDDISSSVLDFSTFDCTESSLQSHASVYLKIKKRNRQAIVVKRNLDKEIEILKMNDPKNELEKKTKDSKMLSRYISRNNGFFGKYDTCKKEIIFNPIVSAGTMSGEAKVTVSEKEYQALAAFEISSPTGLNTNVQSIQFRVDTFPDVGMVVDKWFLLHEGYNPTLCQISPDIHIIDCDLVGDMPVEIMGGMSRTYAIGGHITALHRSGTVDIQISKILFNWNRMYADTKIQSSPLSFGEASSVVDEVRSTILPSFSVAENPVQTVVDPFISAEITATVTPPVVPPVPAEANSIQTVITSPASSETTPAANPDASAPVVPLVPPSEESDVPASMDTTPSPTNSDVSVPVVPPSSEIPPVSNPSSEASEDTPLTDSSDTV